MDYANNWYYFFLDPNIARSKLCMKIGSWLVALGAGIAYLFQQLSDDISTEVILFFAGLAFVGLCFIALAVTLRKKINHGPTDRQLDKQAEEIFNDMDSHAFKKLGVDSSEVSLAEPVKFWGYQFSNPSILGDELNEAAQWLKGADGLIRSSEITMTGFYFGENSFYCYERTFSSLSDAVKESTEEYYYKDVVSVKTESVDVPVVDADGRQSRSRNEEFILANMGGEKRRCTVVDASKAEAAVIAFRALLKQKKL